MCEATKTTKTTKTRKPQARSAKIVQAGDATILWLTVGNDVTAYRVTVLPCAFGKAAFHLLKADKGDGPGEEYDVLLDGQFSRCECKGFLRWNHCKHLEALTALCQCGKIAGPQAAPKPQQAAPEVKPVPQAVPDAKPEATPAKHFCRECQRWGENPFCENCPI
jgi:hypothetical protein